MRAGQLDNCNGVQSRCESLWKKGWLKDEGGEAREVGKVHNISEESEIVVPLM